MTRDTRPETRESEAREPERMARRAELVVDGEVIGLTLRRSQRARRILLKVDVRSRAELVIPRGVAEDEALAFAAKKGEWLKARLEKLPAHIPFKDGANVPVLNVPHRIRQVTMGDLFRSKVWREKNEILATCEPENLAHDVRAWFRTSAKEELSRRARQAAERVGVNVAHVGVRDPHTRWGSCSAAGRLSFSWRLLMSPEWVLDYVVAHEVAHLSEMNHGPAFWQLVACLSDRMDEAKSWLKRSGPQLHRYG